MTHIAVVLPGEIVQRHICCRLLHPVGRVMVVTGSRENARSAEHGVTDWLWEIGDILAVLEEWETAQ